MKNIFNVDDLVRHKTSQQEMYIAKIDVGDANTSSTFSGYYECTWVEFGAESNTFAIFHQRDLEVVNSDPSPDSDSDSFTE